MPHDEKLDPLLSQMIRDDLPWSRSWTTDFPAFAELFTLHDSHWVGLFLPLHVENVAILSFRWDAFWLPEPLKSRCVSGTTPPADETWPLLFIRLEEVSSLFLTGYDTPLSERCVGSAVWSVRGDVRTLELVDVVGGCVRLEFKGATRFLAFRRPDYEVLGLEGVVPSPVVARPGPWWRFW